MNPGNSDPGDDPILELRDHELQTSTEFTGKVRRRIQRRTTANQLAGFSWNMPAVVLRELAGMLSHMVSALGGKKDTKG